MFVVDNVDNVSDRRWNRDRAVSWTEVVGNLQMVSCGLDAETTSSFDASKAHQAYSAASSNVKRKHAPAHIFSREHRKGTK